MSNTVALIKKLEECIIRPDALSELSVLIEEIETNIEQIEHNKQYVLNASNWRATLLLRASYLYIPKLVDFLIKHNLVENVNEVDEEYECSAILFAAHGGYLDIIKMLYAEGADLTLQGYGNQNAVYFSLESGNEAIFNFVWNKLTQERRQAFLDLIQRPQLKKIFCDACEKGCLSIIKVLLKYDPKLIEARNPLQFKSWTTLSYAAWSLNDKVFNFIWDNSSVEDRHKFKSHTFCGNYIRTHDSRSININAFLDACMRGQFSFAQNLIERAPSMLNSKCRIHYISTNENITMNALDIIFRSYSDSKEGIQFAEELVGRGLLPCSDEKLHEEFKDFFQAYFNMSILKRDDRNSFSNLPDELIRKITQFFVSHQHLDEYEMIFNHVIEKRSAELYNIIEPEAKLEDGAKVSDLIKNEHIEYINRVIEKNIAYIADIAIQAIRAAHSAGEQPSQSQLEDRKNDFQNWLRPILKKYYTDNEFALNKSLKLAIAYTVCTIDAGAKIKRQADPFYNVRYETKKAVEKTINELQRIRKFVMDAIDATKYEILNLQLDKIVMATVMELDSFKDQGAIRKHVVKLLQESNIPLKKSTIADSSLSFFATPNKDCISDEEKQKSARRKLVS